MAEFLPYIALGVALPLFGSFCGVDTILRISLLLYIHSAVVSLLPRSWFSVQPLVQFALFIVLVILPLTWLPWVIVWVYGQFLWLTELPLMVAEVVLAQNLVMRYGQRLADKIEVDDNAGLCKGVILTFAACCYGFAASGAWEIYKGDSSVQIGCLCLVLLVIVAVHNMLWMAHEGVISDAAFCSVCMMAVLGAMAVETRLIRSPLPAPRRWSRAGSTAVSAVSLFWSIMTTPSDVASRAVSFLYQFISPFFVVSLTSRVYSTLFIVSKVTKNFFTDEEEFRIVDMDEDDLTYAMSPWRAPLLLKVSIIFMMTQFTTLFLWESSGAFMASVSAWSPLSAGVWPQHVLIGRALQLVAVCTFYMWRLYCAEDWTWCAWLTP